MSAIVEEFFRRLPSARRSVLALDYDGTLAPFRRRRDEAVPYPGVRRVLRRILEGRRTRLVVLSGRPAAEVRALLGARVAAEIWGAHGWEHRPVGGPVVRLALPPPAAATLARARAALAAAGLAAHVEVKSAAVAVHWRGRPDAPSVAARAALALAPLAEDQDFELLPFADGLELRCRRWHKGTALAAVLADEPPSAPVAYLGDDRTDEDAFAVLAGRGLGVRVAAEPGPTRAAVTIAPGPSVREFLERWQLAAESGRPHDAAPGEAAAGGAA